MLSLDPRVENLSIESFSPNCLMGTVGAVSRFKYRLPSISRLFFNYSFYYENSADTISFSPDSEILNISFTKELPIEKKDFLRRLRLYYGLVLYHKPYSRFDDLLSDLGAITEFGEPVMTEIDFYHVRRHPFFNRRHDGHMMIVTGPGQKPASFKVVEAVFGRYDFSLEDYEACFHDVIARNRPFYLATIAQQHDRDRPIEKNALLQDLDRTLSNLTSDQPGRGLRALRAFVRDFDRFHEDNAAGQRRPFLIPGFWAFMCNSMNNARFLAELEADVPEASAAVLRALRTKMLWLNRRWFVLNLAMDRSVEENDFSETGKMQEGLHEIQEKEAETLSLIEALRDAVVRV